MNQYFNRYEFFVKNGDYKIVPSIEIPLKSTDKFVSYKKNIDRFDKFSQVYYDSPFFGWLISLANPNISDIEFEIPDGEIIRIPYPLITTLQEYKKSVNLYTKYYGE